MNPSWLRAGAARKRGPELEERVGSRSVEAGGFGRADAGRGEKTAASRVIGKDSTELAVCLLESI